MEKDFDAWNHTKKVINSSLEVIRFKERDIWWCSLGLNIGSEQDGKHKKFARPVLIIKKLNHKMIWILPLTSSENINPYYYRLQSVYRVKSNIIFSQIRVISTKRLLRRIERVSHSEFKKIIEKFKALI